MKNNEAHEAYKAIDSQKDKARIINRLTALYDYLRKLCMAINPKRFKDPFLYQWTFATETRNVKEYECYVKANLVTATESLGRITKTLEFQDLTKMKKRILLDFICDLSGFIAYFDKSQDFSWLSINTNTHITRFYYNLASHAFWDGQPGEHQEERLALSSSTTFIIRQAIEYKIKRILGVDKILENNRPYLRTTDLCFTALYKNSEFYTLKGFSFSIVKNIYSWTHIYIHGGYRPEPWKTETALTYLKALFYSGKTSESDAYSWYAGIEVKESDLEQLRERTERTFAAKGKYEITWLSGPEVAIIK